MGAAPGQSPLFRARARNVCSSNDSSDIPSFLPIPIPNSLFLSFFQPLLRWWRRRHRRNERTTMQRPQRGPNMTEGIRNGMGGGGGRNAPFSVPTSFPSIFLSGSLLPSLQRDRETVADGDCPFCQIRRHAYTFFPFINVSLSLSLPPSLSLLIHRSAQHMFPVPFPRAEENKCTRCPFGDGRK